MIIPGEIFSLMAAIFWSIAVVIFKSLSHKISPFLINALKNTIALICFSFLLLYLNIPFWNEDFTRVEYIKFTISGLLGMGVADAVFIYALSLVGASRIAILNCLEPLIIYFLTLIFLSSMELNNIEAIGFLIVIISVMIISYEKESSKISNVKKIKGLSFQFIAILCSSIAMVMIKNNLNSYQSDPFIIIQIAVFRLFVGFIISWFILLFIKNKTTLIKSVKDKNIIIKILTSSIIGTFMALTCWILGQTYIQKLALASIIGQTSLIFIMFLSWFFLNEKITSTRIIASIFALFGVFLSNYF
ncbi:MAG: hypothetical protein CMG59_00140 [Candidatus Marinimicrobia bacterium]|nr:hypothetical protein [Candidatus Neomarinimicrobiota bacterium]